MNYSKYKPYPKYKPSKIDWIGDIPENWKVLRVKYLVDTSKYYQIGDGDHGSIKPSMYKNDGIPYIRVQNLSWEGRITFEGMVYIDIEVQNLNLKSKLIPGDILIAKTGATIGKLGIIPESMNEANTTSSVGKITVDEKKFYNKFILYSFMAKQFQYQYLRDGYEKSAQPGFNIEDLIEYRISLPIDKAEQKVIVNFLDLKISEIDNLISKKQHQLKLLEEKKSAIINQAVTKGLDPNVKMKDTGIPWLGDVPYNWQVLKFGRISYMKGRIGWQGLKQSEFTLEGPYLITGMNFKDGKINWDEVYHITEERYNEAPEIQLQVGDVLITKDGTIGKLLFIDYLPDRTSLNSHLLVFRPIDGSYFPKYLYYHLMSQPFKHYIELSKTGTTFYGITQEAVSHYKIILPSINEQIKIVEYLEIELNKILNMSTKIGKEIKLLIEYRSSLISEAVTGKIDLRGEAE